MYSLRQNIKKTIICLFIITTIFLPCVTKPKPSTQSFFFLKDINNFLITQGMKPLAYYGYDEKKSKIISEIFVYFSYISILAILYKLFFKKKKPENNSFISKLGEIHNIKKIENELNKKDQQQQQQNENKLYEHDQKTDLEKQQTENRLKKKKQIMQNYNNTQCNLLKNDTENLQLPVDDTYHLASQYFLANLPDHLFRKNQSSFINRFKKLQQQQDQNNQVEEQQKQQLDMFYKIFTIEKFQKIIENSSKISLETQLNSFVEFENINNFNMQDQQQFNTKNNILPDDLKQKKKTLETILKEFQELNNDNKEQIQQNLEKPQENFQNIQEDDLKKQSDEQSYDSIKKDVENLVERINTKIIEIFKNNNNKPNEEFIKLLTQYNNFYYQYMNDRSLLPDKEEEKIVKMFYIMFYMLKLKILDNYIGNDNIDLNAFCDNVESLLIQTQSLPNCFKTSETIVFLKNLKTKAEYIQYIDGLIEKRKNSAEESNKLKQYRKNIISNIDLEKNIIDIKEYAKELQKQDTIVLLKQLSTQWLKKEININEKNTIEGILETIISFAIEQLQREDGNCIFLMVLQDFFSKNTVLMEKEYSTYFKKIKYIIEFFKIINKYKNNLNNEEYIKQLKDIFKTIENTHNENEIEDSWNKILEKDNEINREILKNAQQEKENKIKNNNQFEEVLQSINFLKSVPSFNSKSLEKLDAFQILKDSQIDELQKSQLYSKQSIDFQNSMTDFNNIWGKKSNIFMNNDNVEKLQKSQIQLNQEKDIFELSENDKQEIAQFIKLIIFDLPKTMIQQLINYTTMEQKIDKADLLKNLCGSLALIHESFNDFYNHNIAIENDDNKDQNLIEKFKNLTNSIKDNEYYYYDFYNLDFIKAIQEFILNNDFCLSIKDTILKTTLDGNNEIQSAVMKKINKALDLIEKYLINIKKNNSEDVKNTINSFRKEIYQEFQNIDENQNIQKNTITWDKFKNIFTQCIAINDLIKDDYHSLTHIVSIQNEINNPNCLSKYINEAIMEDNTIIFNQEQFESCIAMKYFFENKLDNNEEKIQLDTNIEISEEEINMLQLYNKNISNYFKDIKKKYNIDLSFQNLSINNQQSINFGVIMVGWCNNMFNNYFNKNNYPNELEKEKKSIKINKEEIQNNINLLNTIIETASISIENNNKVQQMSQHEENDLLEQTRNEKIVYNLLNEKNYKEDISLKTINFTTGLKKIHILDVLQLESNNLQKLAEENNINFNNLKMIHQKKNLEIKVLFNKESKGDSNFKIKALNKIIKNTQLEINHKQLQIKN